MTRMLVLVVAVGMLSGAAAGCGGGASPGGGTNAAANGEASKPAQQVLADALKAAKAASSVHISGYWNSNPDHHNVFDVTAEKGKGSMGTITHDGFTVDAVVIGSPSQQGLEFCPCTWKAYIRASSAFWADQSRAQGMPHHTSSLGGKWVEFSSSDFMAAVDLGPIVDLTDLQWILGLTTDAMGVLTKEAKTYKGQSVVAVYPQLKMRSLYVAATGRPYPVAAVVNGVASVSFDGWDKSVSVTAPSGAIEISKLGG